MSEREKPQSSKPAMDRDVTPSSADTERAQSAPSAPSQSLAAAKPAAKKAARPATKPGPVAGKKSTARKKAKAEPVKLHPLRVSRRIFSCMGIFGILHLGALATVRFFFPRILFEPKTRFKIGYPSDYNIGVDTKWQNAQRIWVVKEPSRLYVIFAKCTHLGCTPDWIASENKFKCPCHGSGYDTEGVNFEGPAPRPMERCSVEMDPTGQIVVDKSKRYTRDRWNEPGAYLTV